MKALHTAVQRGRCQSVLSLLSLYLSPAAWDTDRQREQARKLAKWHVNALEVFDKYRPSSRAVKCHQEIARILLNNAMQKPDDLNDELALFKGIFVAIEHLIVDCRATCRDWTRTMPWYHIDTITFALARDLIKRVPGCEDAGYALYEKACDVWDAYDKL